ncbi:hypothetical protein ACLK12_08510 [Escherichia coli]
MQRYRNEGPSGLVSPTWKAS